MVASGPAGPRRRLGAELRGLRTGEGLHLDEVAGRLRCSTSKISRLETGKGFRKRLDVRALIRLYDVRGEPHARCSGGWCGRAARRDGGSRARMASPRRFFLDVGGRYAALETEASGDPGVRLRGLTRTAADCRLREGGPLGATAAPLGAGDRAVRRAARCGGRTGHGARPAPNHRVVDESVLFAMVGSPAVMAAQMGHLLDLIGRSNVVVRVLPLTAGSPGLTWATSCCWRFRMHLGSDLVYIEGHAGESSSKVSLMWTFTGTSSTMHRRSLMRERRAEVVRRCSPHHAPPGKAPLDDKAAP